jgi:hypothetical protein
MRVKNVISGNRTRMTERDALRTIRVSDMPNVAPTWPSTVTSRSVPSSSACTTMVTSGPTTTGRIDNACAEIGAMMIEE